MTIQTQEEAVSLLLSASPEVFEKEARSATLNQLSVMENLLTDLYDNFNTARAALVDGMTSGRIETNSENTSLVEKYYGLMFNTETKVGIVRKVAKEVRTTGI